MYDMTVSDHQYFAIRSELSILHLFEKKEVLV